MNRSVQCPSCGSPLELSHRSVRVVKCEACETVSAIDREGVDPLGKSATLTDFMSALSLGAIGTVEGRRFQALGRVRFEYQDGYWDEWYLMFDDGTDAWLEEDEGELTLVRQEPVVGDVPFPASVRPGERVSIAERSIYVMEVGKAKLIGMEGQLPRGHFVGLEMNYLDGISDGASVMLEFMKTGVECFVGHKVNFDDIELENA